MKINWRRFIRPHNILATVFIFLVMWLTSFIHIDHHKLDPFTYGIRDYDVTDIVYSRLRKNETVLDNRIVLVNIGQPDRMMLHRMLERIEAAQPKVIGIDLFLEGKKDSLADALLQQTFMRHQNIVVATVLEGYSAEKDYFEREAGCDTSFSSYTRTGFANFPGNKTNTVRIFSYEENVREHSVYAFSAELSRYYDPTSIEVLKKRREDLTRIHYTSNSESFLRFEPETILDTTINLGEILKDKIILIGYLEDYKPDDPIIDRFFTPLNERYTGRTNPDMYGLVIHANVIRMLLDRNYIRTAPKWITFIFALVLIYVNTFFFFWNYRYFWYFKHFPKILYRWAHVVQVIEIALLFLLTAWVFYAFKITIDCTIAIVGLVLVFDLCIIYYYLRQNINFLGKVPDHFPIRHHKKKLAKPDKRQSKPRKAPEDSDTKTIP